MPDHDYSDYLLDNYGTCELKEKCKCLKAGWIGRGCLHWRPSGMTTLEDLKNYQKGMYDDRREGAD